MTTFLFTICPYVLCFSAGGLICGAIAYKAGRWDEAYYWMFERDYVEAAKTFKRIRERIESYEAQNGKQDS